MKQEPPGAKTKHEGFCYQTKGDRTDVKKKCQSKLNQGCTPEGNLTSKGNGLEEIIVMANIYLLSSHYVSGKVLTEMEN